MNTAQLICFLTISETLNFARAAQQLNITQPAVTRQIQSLEEELNVTLFRRTTRTVELTHSGLMFINDAKKILDILERAKKRTENALEDTRTPFVIGCHIHSELPQFSEILKKMRELYPNIYPHFKVIPFQHLFQHLSEGSVDLITSFEETALQKNIQYKEVGKIGFVALLSKSNPLSVKQGLAAEDFVQEKLILIEPRKCANSIAKAQEKMIKGRFITDIYLSDSIPSSITLTYAGFGTAIIPDIVPDVFLKKDPAFTYLPITNIEKLSYGVYYRPKYRCPEIRDFIQFSKKLFSTGKCT